MVKNFSEPATAGYGLIPALADGRQQRVRIDVWPASEADQADSQNRSRPHQQHLKKFDWQPVNLVSSNQHDQHE